MGYWLLKSDATAFGFTDLETAPAQTTPWEGVRNYQARNLLRDSPVSYTHLINRS